VDANGNPLTAGDFTTFNVGPNLTRYADTTAASNTTYYYRIDAYNSLGESAYSAPVLVQTPVYIAAPAPTSLAVIPVVVTDTKPDGSTPTHASTSTLALTWADNGDASTETGLVLRRSTDPTFPTGATTVDRSLPQGTTSYTDTTLVAGATYYYRVFSTNSSGLSAPSNDGNATTGSAITLASNLGLTGKYYGDVSFTTLKATRIDPTVDFPWNTAAPASGMPTTNYTVRWTGQIQAPTDETYTFYTWSDDDVRLWITDENVPAGTAAQQSLTPVVNRWGSANTSKYASAPIKLIAGHRYNVQMDYEQLSGGAYAHLYWSTDSNPSQRVIPSSALTTTYEGATPPLYTWAGTTTIGTDTK
jgi:hypothetical protein